MSRGSVISVLGLGCSLVELRPRDAPNICLSFRDPALHLETKNPAFFGETIGRVANRISGARIDNLNGQSYKLPANGDEGQTTLHGGQTGWGKQHWLGPFEERRCDGDGEFRPNAQKYTHLSRHGEEGFPGTVEARAWWTTWEEGDMTITEVEYEAELLMEQPEGVEETVVAMTNHSYFNLSPTCTTSSPSIGGSIFTLPTDTYLATRSHDNIPTGEITTLSANCPMQANEPFVLGDNVPVLDHCFVLDTSPETIPIDTRERPLRLCASMMDPKTYIHLQVLSTEPACQIYTGDGIDVEVEDVHFGRRSGIAIEPGRYTNATNQPGWKNMVTLRKGEKYGSRIRYVAWKEMVDGDNDSAME